MNDFAPLDRHLAKPGRHSPQRAYKIASKIVQRSGLAHAFRESIDSPTGRPMDVSWHELMTIFIVHGITKTDMHLTRVEETATELIAARLVTGTRTGRVTYDHIANNLHRIQAHLAAGTVASAHHHRWVDKRSGELPPCPDTCGGGRPIGPDEFSSILLDASVPEGVIDTTSWALDSTDFETWGARRSWRRRPDIAPGEDQPDKADSAPDRSTDEWPRTGADGRDQHSLDPEARVGYKSGKNGAPKCTFMGYDNHIIVPVPAPGGRPVPHVALSLVTAPAGSSKASAGLRAVDAVNSIETRSVKTLLSDRGYTFRLAEDWALHLVGRGIESIHDLHTSQLGQRPGPKPGTVWVDGTLYSSALPTRLRKLNQFTLGMADEAKRELQEQYNERLPYRFDAVPHGSRPGSQRLRGPALKKHVRCPNTPRSMRANFDRPTTNCVLGEECGCGTTVVVHAEEQARERQRIPFGTTEWAASYGRRSAIEHFNAEIKGNRGVRIERGFTRVYGAVKNQVLVTFALVGANVRLLRDWHICRSIADPWMALIDDTDDPDWSVAHARFKRRQPRVRAFHEAYYASRGRPLQAA